MASSDQQPLHQKDKHQEDGGVQEPLPKQKTCSGYCCYKLWTVIYAILFFVIGAVLLAIGAWLLYIQTDYESINDVLTSPAVLALVVGLFMVVTSIVGLVGAAKEHLLLLRIFLAIIIIVFILQVIIGIIAFVFREETITVAGKQLKFAIREYANNEDIKSSVDHVQQRFTCCGLERPTDWDFNKNYSCANHNSKLSCGLPDSCCRTMTVDCGHEMRRHNSMEQLDALGMHTNGCTEKFRKWVEWHLDVVGATALGLALLHVLGIFLVYLFTTSVEDRQWLFKYRKRYYSRD